MDIKSLMTALLGILLLGCGVQRLRAQDLPSVDTGNVPDAMSIPGIPTAPGLAPEPIGGSPLGSGLFDPTAGLTGFGVGSEAASGIASSIDLTAEGALRSGQGGGSVPQGPQSSTWGTSGFGSRIGSSRYGQDSYETGRNASAVYSRLATREMYSSTGQLESSNRGGFASGQQPQSPSSSAVSGTQMPGRQSSASEPWALPGERSAGTQTDDMPDNLSSAEGGFTVGLPLGVPMRGFARPVQEESSIPNLGLLDQFEPGPRASPSFASASDSRLRQPSNRDRLARPHRFISMRERNSSRSTGSTLKSRTAARLRHR